MRPRSYALRIHAAFALALALLFAGSAAAGEAAVPRTIERQVLARVESQVSPELAQYFPTVLYVSKARGGPLAQRMFVLEQDGFGAYRVVDAFAVSTGRERKERYFTSTPTGVFQLDRTRMVRMHRSKTWDNAPMPYAMFIDVSYETRLSGVALHAAYGKAGRAALGKRASGGCVRMPPAKAKALFEDIQAGRYNAYVPQFAFDHRLGSTNKIGEVNRDSSGAPILRSGLSILLVIENYAGRTTVADAADAGGAI